MSSRLLTHLNHILETERTGLGDCWTTAYGHKEWIGVTGKRKQPNLQKKMKLYSKYCSMKGLSEFHIKLEQITT